MSLQSFCVFCKGPLDKGEKLAHDNCILAFARQDTKKIKIIEQEYLEEHVYDSWYIFARKSMQLENNLIAAIIKWNKKTNRIYYFELVPVKCYNLHFIFKGVPKFKSAWLKYSKIYEVDNERILHFEGINISCNYKNVCDNPNCNYASQEYCHFCYGHYCNIHFRKNDLYCVQCKRNHRKKKVIKK